MDINKLLKPHKIIIIGVSAMKRWYLSLPKFTKDSKKKIDGNKIDKRYLGPPFGGICSNR